MNETLCRLVGSNSSSWGWCLKTLKVYHDSRKYRHGVSYPRYYKLEKNQIEQHRFWSQIYTMTLRKLKTCTRDVDEKLRVPETFYMLLDMDRGTLAFQVIFGNMIFQGGIFLLLTIFSSPTYSATSHWWPSPGEQWLFGSCLLGTSRRRTLSNCFCCVGTLRGKFVPWHASDTHAWMSLLHFSLTCIKNCCTWFFSLRLLWPISSTNLTGIFRPPEAFEKVSIWKSSVIWFWHQDSFNYLLVLYCQVCLQIPRQ